MNFGFIYPSPAQLLFSNCKVYSQPDHHSQATMSRKMMYLLLALFVTMQSFAMARRERDFANYEKVVRDPQRSQAALYWW